MTRTIINDEIWAQLHVIMREKGCYATKNNRNIMEAILWKLRTGATCEIFPKTFALGKQLTIVSIAGH